MSQRRRREHPRVPADGLTVSLRTVDGQIARTERVVNISLGGIFIEMDAPLAFGKEMLLEFSIPQGPRTIRCKGAVMWNSRTRERTEGYSGPPGMGVRLMDISVADMRALAEFIDAQKDTSDP